MSIDDEYEQHLERLVYDRQMREAYDAEMESEYAACMQAEWQQFLIDTEPFVPQLPLLIG